MVRELGCTCTQQHTALQEECFSSSPALRLSPHRWTSLPGPGPGPAPLQRRWRPHLLRPAIVDGGRDGVPPRVGVREAAPGSRTTKRVLVRGQEAHVLAGKGVPHGWRQGTGSTCNISSRPYEQSAADVDDCRDLKSASPAGPPVRNNDYVDMQPHHRRFERGVPGFGSDGYRDGPLCDFSHERNIGEQTAGEHKVCVSLRMFRHFRRSLGAPFHGTGSRTR